MSPAQSAIETSPADDAEALIRMGLAPASARKARGSPALALQAAIATSYNSVVAGSSPEPEVRKWPGWARVSFILLAGASSWLVVIVAAALIFRI
jgi:hypothetical protein